MAFVDRIAHPPATVWTTLTTSAGDP